MLFAKIQSCKNILQYSAKSKHLNGYWLYLVKFRFMAPCCVIRLTIGPEFWREKKLSCFCFWNFRRFASSWSIFTRRFVLRKIFTRQFPFQKFFLRGFAIRGVFTPGFLIRIIFVRESTIRGIIFLWFTIWETFSFRFTIRWSFTRRFSSSWFFFRRWLIKFSLSRWSHLE